MSSSTPAPAPTADELGPLWEQIRETAEQVSRHAHAPYSQFRVGAAALCEDGQVVVGCNIENAAFTGLHAEWGVVGAAVAGGHGRLLAISIAVDGGEPPLPCGMCRQVLIEHSGPELLLDRPEGAVRMGTLLPEAFTPAKLAARR